MPRYCVVPGCKSSQAKTPGISLFRVPSDPVDKEIWLSAIGRPNLSVRTSTTVCAKHFKTEDFWPAYASGVLLLRPNVVPTIFTNDTAEEATNDTTMAAISPNSAKNTAEEGKNSVFWFETMKNGDSTSQEGEALENVVIKEEQPSSSEDEEIHDPSALVSIKLEPEDDEQTNYGGNEVQLGMNEDNDTTEHVSKKMKIEETADGVEASDEEIGDPSTSSVKIEEDDTKVWYGSMEEENDKEMVEDPDYVPNGSKPSAAGKVVSNSVSKERGEVSHAAAKPFSCSACSYSTARPALLKKHALKHALGETLSCAACDFTTRTIFELDTHALTHTGEKPFGCSECDYKTKHRSNLSTHVRSAHTGDNLLTCPLCNFRTVNSYHLRQHAWKHTEQKPYHCEVCDYRTNHQYNFEVHKRTHTGVKPYACKDCSYQAVSSSALKAHVKDHHMDEKPFACTDCSFATTSAVRLKVHVRRHTGEKPYVCTECSFSSAYLSNLKKHMYSHTGEKPLACPDCSFRAVKPSDLKQHMLKHSKQKPLACPDCDFTTAYKHCLTHHMRRHGGEKQFQCSVCDYQTLDSTCLKRHMVTHSGEKPFRCDRCPYRTARLDSLKLHARKHTE